MNVRMIDILLKELEEKACEIHYCIDRDFYYIQICDIVTRMDMGEKISFKEKVFVRDALRDNLFPIVGLNYERVFRRHFMTAFP